MMALVQIVDMRLVCSASASLLFLSCTNWKVVAVYLALAKISLLHTCKLSLLFASGITSSTYDDDDGDRNGGR